MPIDVKPGIPMPSTYAFIRCDGRLQFCDGIPGSVGILGSMDTEAGAGRGTTATFTIHRAGWGGHGLHGHIIDDPGPDSTSPPDPVASCLVSALGGPDQHIRGNLVIGGDRAEPGFESPAPCGLTEAQERLIHDVHKAVLMNAHAPQG